VPFDTTTLLLIVAVVVVAVVAILLLRRGGSDEGYGALSHASRFRRRPHRDHFRQDGRIETPPKRRIGVVVNPTKFPDVEAVRRQISSGCEAAGWGEPIWFETTAEDPGFGQAKACVEQGATVVCPLGGDGTIRQVAIALRDSDTPIGLLPGGTANLLSRNLALPDDLDKALHVALTGQNKRIDVGWLRVDDAPEQMFLVMAGMGFDGAVMAQTDEKLKSTMGTAAYTVSGFRNWLGPQFKIEFSVDGNLPLYRRTRSVLFGNCGKIYGGLVLMPDALVDDGALDAVIISPKGVVGWAAVLARVVTKNHKGHERFDHHQGREFRVAVTEPQEVQVDGDSLGLASVLTARVEPAAVLVRIGA
jgi:diacylglycerol kinase family enzyme